MHLRRSDKQALHQPGSHVESSKSRVFAGPYLQYRGGGRRITTLHFFSLPLERAGGKKRAPYKAEHDYSAVKAKIQEHKTLIGLRCQQ